MSVEMELELIRPKGPVLSKAAILRALQNAVTGTVAEGTRYMAEYPPAPPDQRYRRTGTLKRSWSFKPAMRRGDYIEGIIGSNGNIAPYNQQVQGTPQFQEPFFRRRGWRGVDELIRLVQRELPVRAQRAIDYAAEGQ